MNQVQVQFFLQNAHFVINVITAIVFFAISWLYFDAWLIRRHAHSSLKWIGLLLVSVSFLVHSAYIEQVIFVFKIFGEGSIENIAVILRILGYTCIIIGLLGDRLQKRPDTSSEPLYGLGFLIFLSGVSFFTALLLERNACRNPVLSRVGQGELCK